MKYNITSRRCLRGGGKGVLVFPFFFLSHLSCSHLYSTSTELNVVKWNNNNNSQQQEMMPERSSRLRSLVKKKKKEKKNTSLNYTLLSGMSIE